MKATHDVFGDSFVPELREILTSISSVISYGPDGKQQTTTEQPFTHPWQLQWIGVDEDSAGSRVTCVLEADGKVVTATIEAGDFRRISQNKSKTQTWNSSEYHDMAVLVSTLIEEQILTWDPAELSNEIQIRLPTER